MNKEIEIAIEQLQSTISIFEDIEDDGNLEIDFIDVTAIKILINYIKKLEKENKKYKKLANKNLENEIIFREKHMLDEIYELQAKIEDSISKSKIRKLIAEYSVPTENGKRHISYEDMELFFMEVLKLTKKEK